MGGFENLESSTALRSKRKIKERAELGQGRSFPRGEL